MKTSGQNSTFLQQNVIKQKFDGHKRELKYCGFLYSDTIIHLKSYKYRILLVKINRYTIKRKQELEMFKDIRYFSTRPFGAALQKKNALPILKSYHFWSEWRHFSFPHIHLFKMVGSFFGLIAILSILAPAVSTVIDQPGRYVVMGGCSCGASVAEDVPLYG